MYCPNCGKENENNSVFCYECGYKLTGDTTPAQPQPEPVPQPQPTPVQPQPEQDGIVCPACGMINPAGSVFCYNDGRPLGDVIGAPRKNENKGYEQPSVKCPYCGIMNAADSVFCFSCGRSLTSSGGTTDFNNKKTSSDAGKKNYTPLIIGITAAIVVIILAVGFLIPAFGVTGNALPWYGIFTKDSTSADVPPSDEETLPGDEPSADDETISAEPVTDAPTEPATTDPFFVEEGDSYSPYNRYIEDRYPINKNYKTTATSALNIRSTPDADAKNIVATLTSDGLFWLTDTFEDTSATDPTKRYWGYGTVNGKSGWVSMYFMTPVAPGNETVSLGNLRNLLDGTTWKTVDDSFTFSFEMKDGKLCYINNGNATPVTAPKGDINNVVNLFGSVNIDLSQIDNRRVILLTPTVFPCTQQ